MGLFGTKVRKKYEGNDNDIKLVSFDSALWTAISGFNPEPAGAKNDNDGARLSGSNKRKGARARYGVWKGVDSGQTFNKKVPILTKTVYAAMEAAAGDESNTTYNFTWNGLTMRLQQVFPENNRS